MTPELFIGLAMIAIVAVGGIAIIIGHLLYD